MLARSLSSNDTTYAGVDSASVCMCVFSSVNVLRTVLLLQCRLSENSLKLEQANSKPIKLEQVCALYSISSCSGAADVDVDQAAILPSKQCDKMERPS